MTLQCGHTFCHGCSRNLNRCAICRAPSNDFVPDYAKRMHILELTVRCSHEACPVTDSLRVIHHHEQVCEYRVVPCRDCKQDIQQREVMNHTLFCEQRKVPCEVCVKMYRIHTEHLCPLAPTSCTLCVWTGNRLELEQHDKECKNNR